MDDAEGRKHKAHERLVKQFLAAAKDESPGRYALICSLYPVRTERGLALRRRREIHLSDER